MNTSYFNGLFIATGDEYGVIRLWDTVDYECKQQISIGNQSVSLIEFSPFGDVIVSASQGYRFQNTENIMIVTSLVDTKRIINEQADLTLALLKSKIRTPYVIIDYMSDFMMGIRYSSSSFK